MPQRVLAVDDDFKILKILQHSLQKEGFEVLTASGGEEALEKARQFKPDLVLLDLMMPGMDGFETYQKLKAQREDLPVIILTAKTDEVDRIVGFRMGVDDYQTKPFSPTELALRAKAVLRRTGGTVTAGQKVLEYGGLVIDYTRRQVTLSGKKVELTPKEFELLWLMASNPNRVFSKTVILDKVWDSAYYGDENTVTVHVRRLREKLEPDPSRPRYIKTVWGAGYKFEWENKL
ncbi:MAG: response regulator transcription factor [Firmicutes bacterium]|nr:response regulator transcription factor [Bacillota bacterium]